MRRVYRLALSDATQELLCKRTVQIAEAGLRRSRIGERIRARKAEAERLWKQERTKPFDEIDAALRDMAPGHELCMYCEYSKGTDIDHFWPKERYPGRAFWWENYLWSCGECNSHFKRSQFPRDERGAPLLIHPAEEDPREHLALSVTTGKLVGLTQKGSETIRVLGFERRGNLDRERHAAWRGVQALILQYAACCRAGDSDLALYLQRCICRHPLAGALLTLRDLLDTPAGASRLDQEIVAAIEAHPEILTWP
ncbi:MAG: hypothetical protein IT372_28025 [Polyangiaceae bacterium]|nr:hypothetical protein [Polyangiaceae bacterium]